MNWPSGGKNSRPPEKQTLMTNCLSHAAGIGERTRPACSARRRAGHIVQPRPSFFNLSIARRNPSARRRREQPGRPRSSGVWNFSGAWMLVLGIFLTMNSSAQPALKDVFKNDFLIGAALNPAQFCESNAMEAALIRRQFNTITPENVLKWELVHPAPGRYDFTLADRYVEFGETNGMAIIGHTLVWHQQTPAGVFQDDQGNPVSREVLLARMREHILTVVGRYKGRIRGWDVVNEALAEDGTLRPSPWRKIIGEDFILKAYQFAHEADPQAELYYNDYSLENKPKQRGAVALIRQLQAQGVKIAAVGLQSHVKMGWPSPGREEAAIAAFAKLGVKVNITELDVDVLPPDSYYGNIRDLFEKLEGVGEMMEDPRITSVRLVTNAEKMVVRETQRAFV